ncbi:MAG TPA: GGDEF domain-containing protein [Egibacteraceae bacterium]|nr:GGDEF domain-containing protein [Egibacteraceae bacterium]
MSLLDAGVEVAYQPIVHLGSGAVIAYEALARPRHAAAGDPLVYFAALERAGLRLDGERQAVRAAVEGTGGKEPRAKLFVNVSPTTLVDPRFDIDELLEGALRSGLSATDLVVEVTESEAIHDLEALGRKARRLRHLGIGLAVDDAGAGHASFRVITRLRPSYIKLDRDLVTGVDADGPRHAFIDAMVRFSRQIGSRLIAEGIETDFELVSLAGLGVEAGQGYYLARPTIGQFVMPSRAARRAIASAAQRLQLGAAQVTIGELARPATVVDPGLPVRDAYARFVSDPSLGMLVVAHPGPRRTRLAGQLARRAVEQRYIAGLDDWTRVSDVTVGEVADRQPLTVEASLDLVEVAAIMAARDPAEATDDIVVTDPRGDVVGVVSVRDVLRTLAGVRHQGVEDVNPVSGLVGRGWVEAELRRRLDSGEATTMLFVDLDGFRRVNDLGGFAAGDEVIRSLARCLAGVAAGVEDAAVAHVSGDHFLLLVSPRRHDELLGKLVPSVESEVIPLVRTVLHLPGGVDAEGIALSIGAVELEGQPPPGNSYLEWARNLLSPLLQTAKDYAGHSCVHRAGRTTTLSTWTRRRSGPRRVAVGLAEPSVVLRALDLIGDTCARWSGQAPEVDLTVLAADREGTARPDLARLLDRYAGPLRSRAAQALAAGVPAMEVSLEGDEDDLLAWLDAIARVTSRAGTGSRTPVPPEHALLDRLARERGRMLTRQDRVSTLAD